MDLLIQQVADEHGLEMAQTLGGAVPAGKPAEAQEDDLAARLAKLKAN